MPRAAYKPRDAVSRYFDEVIALIREGHSLDEACGANPEYPTKHSFRRYAQKDAERNLVLRDAVAAADAIRKDRRYHRSDDAYDEVLRIIAATPDKRVRHFPQGDAEGAASSDDGGQATAERF